MMFETNFLEELPLELLSKTLGYLRGAEVLKLRALSRYFYSIISDSAISTVRYDSSLLSFRPHVYYDLNIISNLNTKNKQVDDLRQLSNQSPTDILSSFQNTQMPNSLKELRFSFEGLLDLNKLEIFAKIAPSLEILDIRSCAGLENQLYVGSELSNLKSFRIYTYGQNISKSPDDLITSFLDSTPQITHVALLGGFFQNDNRMSLTFIKNSKTIESLGLELPHTCNNQKMNLPLITPGTNYLKELFIDGHEVSSKQTPLQSKLNIDTFYYSGNYCLESINFYGIGETLTSLFLKPYNTIDNLERLTEICSACPNLEELGILFISIPIEWLIDITSNHCKNLQLVSFISLKVDNEDNIRVLSTGSNIKNIYLCQKISEEGAQWLTGNGFNLYNGRKNEFDIFIRNPINDSSWFMWR